MRTLSIVVFLIAACVALPAAADQINLPARKPGQWKIEMLRGTAPAMTIQLCLDTASDKAMMATMSHTVITGDFQSAYTIKTISDLTGGGPLMPKHSETTQNVTWVGECNGLKPGEMMMPGGMKINTLNAMKPMGG